jgi:hypothetical protein
MSLLDHPHAQALLADASVTPERVRACRDRLTAFLQRYLPRFYRVERRINATLVIRGLVSGLERKTCEPIAVEAGVHRKPIQFLVGSGGWDDEAVMAEVRRDVREALGDDQAILVLGPSGFPKSGTESCGVARQWCGRLGKQDDCQIGVFLIYAAPGGYAPLDRRLYLPEDWANDPDRRAKAQSPRTWPSRSHGGSPSICWSGAVGACPTPGSPGMTSWAARRHSAAGYGGTANGISSTCPATRASATWSADVRGLGARDGAGSGRCRSAVRIPGRHGDRRAAGPG